MPERQFGRIIDGWHKRLRDDPGSRPAYIGLSRAYLALATRILREGLRVWPRSEPLRRRLEAIRAMPIWAADEPERAVPNDAAPEAANSTPRHLD